MYPVIVSGGVGSRLWPLSRAMCPKPFIPLPSGQSLLQHTAARALTLHPSAIVNMTRAPLLFDVQREWKALFPRIPLHYILEPRARNTAAPTAIASLWIAQHYGPEALVLLLPSDHYIANETAFCQAVEKAVSLAHQDRIVTLGITPDGPHTGYGYIEHDGTNVTRFVEKPSGETALDYVASGRYLWNAGIFCFKAAVMIAEMRRHCPDILSAAEACIRHSLKTSTEPLYLDNALFSEIREDSIDYAVIEKSSIMSVVPCDMGWNDIGNWESMASLYTPDSNGNVAPSTALLHNTHDCYIQGEDRVIATVGLDNLVIIDTRDALLVAHKDATQDVKQIYQRLAQANHPLHASHSSVARPWGSYTVLEESATVKIKRIEVHPEGTLSLQSHRYRAEHWVVVEGTALVVNGDREMHLGPNESTYIPAGHKHRLSNPSSRAALVIIEVQTGSYVGEDDIERFDDVYGRIALG